MDKETFHYLWEECITKTVEDVWMRIPSEFRNKYNVKADVSDTAKERVCNKYESIRQKVRTNFFDTGDSDENKMDGHKICSCITGALLDERLISFETSTEEIPILVYESNYAVAFWASIHLLYIFLLSEFKKAGYMEKYDYLYKKARFEFPDTTPGHDSYIEGRIKTLALNDICGIDFDVLSYADMLFWIEKYNRDLINGEMHALAHQEV